MILRGTRNVQYRTCWVLLLANILDRVIRHVSHRLYCCLVSRGMILTLSQAGMRKYEWAQHMWLCC